MATNFGLTPQNMTNYSQQYNDLLNRMNKLNSTPIEHRGLKLIPKGSLESLITQLTAIDNPYRAYMEDRQNKNNAKYAADANKLSTFQKGLMGLMGASYGVNALGKAVDVADKLNLVDKVKSIFKPSTVATIPSVTAPSLSWDSLLPANNWVDQTGTFSSVLDLLGFNDNALPDTSWLDPTSTQDVLSTLSDTGSVGDWAGLSNDFFDLGKDEGYYDSTKGEYLSVYGPGFIVLKNKDTGEIVQTGIHGTNIIGNMQFLYYNNIGKPLLGQGTYISHGCMRVQNDEWIELRERTKAKTPVKII